VPNSDPSSQLCTFYLGDLYLGLPVDRVQEVLTPQEITPVPLAPPALRGLINLRGDIVAAIDLWKTSLAPASSAAVRPPERPMNVVVRRGTDRTSLLVDGVDEVVAVDPARLEAVPTTLSAGVRALVRGVHPIGDQLLLLLDVDRLIAEAASQRGVFH
jgi:purine-binding chemotaxis protein CheW